MSLADKSWFVLTVAGATQNNMAMVPYDKRGNSIAYDDLFEKDVFSYRIATNVVELMHHHLVDAMERLQGYYSANVVGASMALIYCPMDLPPKRNVHSTYQLLIGFKGLPHPTQSSHVRAIRSLAQRYEGVAHPSLKHVYYNMVGVDTVHGWLCAVLAHPKTYWWGANDPILQHLGASWASMRHLPTAACPLYRDWRKEEDRNGYQPLDIVDWRQPFGKAFNVPLLEPLVWPQCNQPARLDASMVLSNDPPTEKIRATLSQVDDDPPKLEVDEEEFVDR